MVLTSASLPAKRRILAVCVKLFLEQGYKRTTVAEIVQKADVSNSSLAQLIFSMAQTCISASAYNAALPLMRVRSPFRRQYSTPPRRLA